ncbi:hypothetical protein C5167_031584 [Papaver somniferum]|uniref:Uncharacterized protein n=1 Tax=Papaver somniferum TaxID=3469 RepID=A0A4Y7K8R9_PAPSO|nr:hypothetical protein C5167_031584 [Papaver somniferum]
MPFLGLLKIPAVWKLCQKHQIHLKLKTEAVHNIVEKFLCGVSSS